MAPSHLFSFENGVLFVYNLRDKICACVLAASSLFLSGYISLSKGENITRIALDSPLFKKSSTVNTTPSTQNYTIKFRATNKEESASSTIETSSKSTTRADTKKVGKITKEFISPYSANTKYNNVYLNNQSGESINIKTLLSSYKNNIDMTSDEPQVLIMHTHATENYSKSNDGYYRKSDLERTSNVKNNVIGIGNEVERVLKDGGVSVIHDKTLHDSPSYSGSYNRSYTTVENYLKKYPSIKVVLDIHRDAIGSSDNLIKPVAEINKKDAAQVMICVGSNTGEVDYFPNWKKNLTLGLKLQQTLEVLYPGLARALFLAKERCYNQNLSNGSIIIEFGTNANTYSEAEYSAKLVGNALVTLFKNG